MYQTFLGHDHITMANLIPLLSGLCSTLRVHRASCGYHSLKRAGEKESQKTSFPPPLAVIYFSAFSARALSWYLF